MGSGLVHSMEYDNDIFDGLIALGSVAYDSTRLREGALISALVVMIDQRFGERGGHSDNMRQGG